MLDGIGSLTTGNIPGNLGNTSSGPSNASGSASANNTLGSFDFGGMETMDYVIVGAFLLAVVVAWKKL